MLRDVARRPGGDFPAELVGIAGFNIPKGGEPAAKHLFAFRHRRPGGSGGNCFGTLAGGGGFSGDLATDGGGGQIQVCGEAADGFHLSRCGCGGLDLPDVAGSGGPCE